MVARSWPLALVLVVTLAACGRSERTHPGTRARTPAEGGAGPVGGGGAPEETGGASGGSTPGTAGRSMAAVGGTGVEPCPSSVSPTSQLVRLTGKQFDSTLRDLLGVTTLSGPGSGVPSSVLGPDSSDDLTDRDWAGYQAAAAAVAAQVLSDANLRPRFFACTPDAEQSVCLHDTIVAFGHRAFRRPLTDAEVSRFEAIADAGSRITEHGTLDEVAAVILETFLVSPSFLQRVEVSAAPDADGPLELSQYEVATRLSYFLWGSTPDSILAAAADAGELGTSEQIAAQASRMIADPRVRDTVRALHRYYLGLDAPGSRWSAIDKAPERFPAFTSDTAAAALAETERFFEQVVVDQGGAFADLFTSPAAFVNASTAALYGLEPGAFGTELEHVELDGNLRPGFLTRIGFLAAHAYRTRTAPQLRGAFIVRNLLDLGIPPHPPDLEVSLPDDPTLDTNRKLVSAQDAGPACVGCHSLIDPPGFVLEAFDAAGVLQTLEADTGAPIDTSADVTLSTTDTQHVANPAELMRALSASPEARRRYAEQLVSYAFTRAADANDRCVVERLAGLLASDGYPLLELLAEVPQADSFRVRVREEP